MLMGTFALFVLVGPIVRSVLCVANLVLPWTKGCHELLLTAINIVGAFSAWEVFAIATYMVDDLIPTVTNTIIQKQICNQPCLVPIWMCNYGLCRFSGPLS